MSDIPKWAMTKAAELVNKQVKDWHPNTRLAGIIALACYIAEHEQPPVDPLLLEAREIVAVWFEQNPSEYNVISPGAVRAGKWDADPTVTQALAALRRGIEIWGQQ